jgi:hypothetical protein
MSVVHDDRRGRRYAYSERLAVNVKAINSEMD